MSSANSEPLAINAAAVAQIFAQSRSRVMQRAIILTFSSFKQALAHCSHSTAHSLQASMQSLYLLSICFFFVCFVASADDIFANSFFAMVAALAAAPSAELFFRQLADNDVSQDYHQDADQRPDPHPSDQLSHPSVWFIIESLCLRSDPPAKRNQPSGKAGRNACADSIHSSHQTFSRASLRRARTETSPDSAGRKSRTSFHRVRRGVRWLRPRSFRRWGLWSRILILSWFCYFLGLLLLHGCGTCCSVPGADKFAGGWFSGD